MRHLTGDTVLASLAVFLGGSGIVLLPLVKGWM